MGGTPGQPIGGPPGIQDAPKGSNPAFIACGCARRTAGDPVDTSTGYFGQSFTDLATPGRGLPLNFTRSYAEGIADPNGPNKTLAADGPFGWGWTYSYNLTATTDATTGNVTVHQEDGSQVTFIDSSGSYAPSAPRYDAGLVKSGSDYVFTRRGRDVFTFDAASGRLTAETDLAGTKASPPYRTSLAYDGTGHLSTITDPAGRAYTLTWTGTHITGLADQSGRTVSYAYDASDDLSEVIDVGGGHTLYSYTAAHLMTSMRSPKNYGGASSAVTGMAYDSAERVTSQTDPDSHATTFTYAPDGGLSAGQVLVTDPAGHKTLDTYQNGLLTSETKGYGTSDAGTSSYTYDPVTLGVSTQTDPDGNLETFTYDDHGNTTSESNALGSTTNYSYDGSGNLLETIDPDGVATVNQYDQVGQIPSGAAGVLDLTSTTVTRANNVVESTTGNFGPAPTRTTGYYYDDAAHPGDRTRTTDPNGKTTTTAYDAFGDKSSVTDPLGHKTTYGYNTATGLLTSTVDANGKTTTDAHDAYGNVTATTDPLGHQTSATFDADGEKTSVTDANNRTTTSTFDAAGLLTKITRADSSAQTTDYNADGSVADTVDALNAKTSYGYDGQGRQNSRADADNHTTTAHLDAAGRLLTTTDAAGRTTTLGYDAAGRTTSVSYSDGVTPSASYGYDAAGHRVTMTDGTGTTTWSFDVFGEVTAQTQGSGASVTYGYDAGGHQTSIAYPGQTTPVTRTFDDAGRLATVTDFSGNTTTFGYDAAGHLTTTSYPNGTKVTDTFDDAGGRTATTAVTGGTTVLAATYTRDTAGQLASQTVGGVSENIGYTPREQVASAGTESFTYDTAGHPTTVGTTTQTFDPAGRLTNAGFGFDNLGERTAGAGNTYGYDQAGRLTSATTAAGTSHYSYDGAGRRAAKTAGGTTSTFVWGTGAELLSDGATNYLYGPDGLPIEQLGAAGAAWFVHDQIGSTIGLLNTAGALAGSFRYTAYGASTFTGTVTTLLRFTGQYTDAETGLTFLRSRYYDPLTAQFLTVDPKVNSTQDAYGYAAQNPFNLADPDGEDWIDWVVDTVTVVVDVAAEVATDGADTPFLPEEDALLQAALRGMLNGARDILTNKAVGDAASVYLQQQTGGDYREYDPNGDGKRRYDVYDSKTGTGYESKVGRTGSTRRTRAEIAQDTRNLREAGNGIDSVEWHFFRSPTTGTIGCTEGLAERLMQAGITAITHL
ncbi:RHS repeat-associated core domain-containing protein [Amycolatopsis tolypomycina]|uniref:RHS repeat-associated core domain-containing protein n=1 Tax=Amycolatopsis tolypomycina TaxID=208445 RepID=UPI0033BD361A